MKTEEKQAIAGELKVRLRKESQNSLAVRCGISPATLSQMLNNNWKLIADKMWRRVTVALKIDFNWKTAETKNYKMLVEMLNNCKQRSMSVGVSNNPGTGKSHTYKLYERAVENVFYLECKTFWTRKQYMKAMLQTCGITGEGKIFRRPRKASSYY